MEFLSSDIKAIDKYCIEKLGMPELVLMENAALSVLANMDTASCKKATIVCGTGNNGGDGLALSRLLNAEGIETDIYVIGSIEKMSPACRKQYEILNNMEMEIRIIESADDIENLKISISTSMLTLDSIFGTGLKRELSGLYLAVVDAINKESVEIISIDVPSGLNSDNGEILTNCIKAHKTVTFIGGKKGFEDRGQYTGQVIVENIGVSDNTVEKALAGS